MMKMRCAPPALWWKQAVFLYRLLSISVVCTAAEEQEKLHDWDAQASIGMTPGSTLSFEEWYRAKNSGLGNPISRYVDELNAWRLDPQPAMPAERVRGVPDGMPAVIVKNVLSREECKALIDGMPSEGGSGYMNSSQVSALYRDRVVKARVLSNDTRLAQILFERLRPHIPSTLDGGRVLGLASAFRFVHYDKEGHQACHVDGREPGDPRFDELHKGWVQSRLTVQVYLNGHGKDFAGGGLSFQDVAGESKHHIVPDAGDVVIFYQERLHPPTQHPPVELHHTAHSVEWGEKFICRTMVDYVFPTRERAALGNLKDDAALRSSANSPWVLRPLSVLAIGNTIIDNVMSMEKVPIDSKVFVNSKSQYVGGQASNAVRAMALLGANVTFVTRLGDDPEGRMADATYRAEGIDVSLNAELDDSCRGARTMSAVIVVETSTQQRTILMHRDEKLFGDFARAVAAASAALSGGKFDVVYTDGHQLELALPIAQMAASLGIPVVADLETLDDERGLQLAAIANDLISPLALMQAMSAKERPKDALIEIARRHRNISQVLVATDGAEGSYWLDHTAGSTEDDRFVHAAALKAKAVDTTGAGDSFHAGYLVARYGYMKLPREAVDFATRVGAAATETPGPVVGREALVRYGLLSAAA